MLLIYEINWFKVKKYVGRREHETGGFKKELIQYSDLKYCFDAVE